MNILSGIWARYKQPRKSTKNSSTPSFPRELLNTTLLAVPVLVERTLTDADTSRIHSFLNACWDLVLSVEESSAGRELLMDVLASRLHLIWQVLVQADNSDPARLKKKAGSQSRRCYKTAKKYDRHLHIS